jgi:hypothetical protein
LNEIQQNKKTKEVIQVTDTKVLRELIKKSGYKYSFIAQNLGISYQALRNKITNRTEFLPTEIETLCKLLELNDIKQKNDIFFASFVE